MALRSAGVKGYVGKEEGSLLEKLKLRLVVALGVILRERGGGEGRRLDCGEGVNIEVCFGPRWYPHGRWAEKRESLLVTGF